MKTWENPKLISIGIEKTEGGWRHIYQCEKCGETVYSYAHFSTWGNCPICGGNMPMIHSYYNDYAVDVGICPCSS